jgi:hypothetical protein
MLMPILKQHILGAISWLDIDKNKLNLRLMSVVLTLNVKIIILPLARFKK